jgi:hypothetical protein
VGCFSKNWIMYRQSSRMMTSSFVMLMKSGLCAIAIWIGLNSPAPPGIPNEACCSLPANFWNLLRDIRLDFSIFRIRSRIAWHFAMGSCNVPRCPLRIQPRTSFSYAHVPSPFSNFGSETGSCPLWPLMLGGGKTEWIPSIMALDIFRRC